MRRRIDQHHPDQLTDMRDAARRATRRAALPTFQGRPRNPLGRAAVLGPTSHFPVPSMATLVLAEFAQVTRREPSEWLV